MGINFILFARVRVGLCDTKLVIRQVVILQHRGLVEMSARHLRSVSNTIMRCRSISDLFVGE